MDEVEAETFEDAAEEVTVASSMDLETAIEEARVALNLFLNNRFEMAKAKMAPWAKDSMYHALGYATVLFIKALMTCEQKDIEEAVQATKEASQVCDRFRRSGNGQSSLSKLVRNFEKAVYTEEQMHAELCYAEALLQRALLTFIQDENLVSFVKGALKIRACYLSYKECQRILSDNECWSRNSRNEKLRSHFESGVQMGIGTFNLMISALPSRVLRLLEFVGFSGNKSFGLTLLEAGSSGASETLRGPLCSLILLVWHLVFVYIVSNGETDLRGCQKILIPLIRNYPKGTMILYFSGRLAEVRGDLVQAVADLHMSIDSQSEWHQFRHLCYWELTFCYAFTQQWSKAGEYAYKLFTESRWSKATYAYMTAVFLLAKQNSKEMNTIQDLLKEVPALKMRIAGKSLPMEKFCVMKANRYFKKGRLPLAHYEVLYLWNGFNILGRESSLVKLALNDVEAVFRQHQEQSDLDDDDYCLCLLLKAMCLKHLQSPFQAEQCLLELITYEKRVSDNYFLIPSALFELALLKSEENNVQEAKYYLMKARVHKDYAMETRLHFRMHALNDRLSLQTPE